MLWRGACKYQANQTALVQNVKTCTFKRKHQFCYTTKGRERPPSFSLLSLGWCLCCCGREKRKAPVLQRFNVVKLQVFFSNPADIGVDSIKRDIDKQSHFGLSQTKCISPQPTACSESIGFLISQSAANLFLSHSAGWKRRTGEESHKKTKSTHTVSLWKRCSVDKRGMVIPTHSISQSYIIPSSGEKTFVRNNYE